MIRLFPLLLIPFVLLLSPLAAEPIVVEGTAAAKRHTTKLFFKNGKYTSIFGLVPRAYTIDSEEQRQIIQTPESDTAFKLELVSSTARRILSIAEEVPTVEESVKPLTGKTIRATKNGESWGYDVLWGQDVLGQAGLTESEKKEAERLVARFKPGTSPFDSPDWKEDGTWTLDLANVLTYLGYTQLSDITGNAVVRRSGESSDKSWPLTVVAAFNSGEKKEKVVIEIDAKGALTMNPEQSGVQNLELAGQLVIHGYRDLQDGRNVPYSLVTSFDYKTETSPVAVTPPAPSSH